MVPTLCSTPLHSGPQASHLGPDAFVMVACHRTCLTRITRSAPHSDPGAVRRRRSREECRGAAVQRAPVQPVPRHIGKRVLEVGSGSGPMSRPLADAADLVVGLEPNINCVKRLEDAMRGVSALRTARVPSGRVRSRRARGASFRHGVLLNVLEHIEDDVAALRSSAT